MSDTSLILGTFVFENFEIPASINFGGEQRLSVHELVGGKRVIDAMGPAEGDISWEGLMLGPDALGRAMQIDAMRIAGQPMVFSVFSLQYYVIIANFVFHTERYYQVTYNITLKVVDNYSQPAGILSQFGFSDAILSDFATANTIAGLINDPTLNSAMGTLNTAISSVSSFENAPIATINSVSGSVSNAINSLSSQINSVQSRLFGS